MKFIEQKIHENGLEYLHIQTPLCEAKLFLQGAQVISFIPKNKPELLWVSEKETYDAGTSFRGGAPLCWPWFGTHPDSSYPAHGFARNHPWNITHSDIKENIVTIQMTLPEEFHNTKYWPHSCQLQVTFEFSNQLKISLTTTNLDTKPIEFTQAIHTYFNIGDIHQLEVEGLNNTSYIEFGKPYTQDVLLESITKETDRIYQNTASSQYLHTSLGTIEVHREHSKSCVLWNPWIEKSKRLQRFDDQDYKTMVCLEAGNILDDHVVLAPQQETTLTQIIHWKDD